MNTPDGIVKGRPVSTLGYVVVNCLAKINRNEKIQFIYIADII